MLSRLPPEVRRAADNAYDQFRTDPSDPSLRFKPLRGMKDLYSARVTPGYRVVGRMRDNAIIWFWLGTHADYDLLRSGQ